MIPKEIPPKEFWQAVRTSDVAALEKLCLGKTLPNFSDKEKENHLLSGAMERNGDLTVLRSLIKHGVDPDEPPIGGSGFPPLAQAVFMGRLDYLEFVLSLGSDPNKGLVDHRVTLIALSSQHPLQKHLELLAPLIQHGVDLNCLFPLFGDKSKSFTVLDQASDEGVRSFLREHGAKTAKELSEGVSQPTNTQKKTPQDEVIDFMRSLFGEAEPRTFTDILNAGSGIAVHVIQPKTPKGEITLFTTGLSHHRMKVPKGSMCSGFGELYMQLPGKWKLHDKDSKWKWPVQLMLDLASYPFSQGGFFDVPVTVISNGDPPERLHPSVPFEATALLADKDFTRSDGQTIHLFCVMPIYEAEAAMARQFIPDFLKGLDQAGVGRILNPKRANIASS